MNSSKAKEHLKTLSARKGELIAIIKVAGKGNAPENAKTELSKVSQEIAILKKTIAEQKIESIAIMPSSTTDSKPAYLLPFKTEAKPADQIDVLDEVPPEWDHYLKTNSTGSTYHTHAILDLIKESLGHKSIIIIARRNGKIIGGLPITIIDSMLLGRFGISLPHFSYGGPSAESLEIAKQLIDKSVDLLASHKLKHIQIRTLQPNLPYPSDTEKVSMLTPLPGKQVEFTSTLPSKIRSQIKSADKHPLKFSVSHEGLTDDFYEVYTENMRDLGSPHPDKKWFQNILSTKSLNAFIAIGYLNGKAASAGLLIQNQDIVEIVWASTLKKYNKKNLNMWFYAQILDHCNKCGFTSFDFGRSNINSGTYNFKRQWGAEPTQHYWYNISSDSKTLIKKESKKISFIIKAWTYLPLFISRRLGPILFRQIG